MIRTVKIDRESELTLWEKLYIPEIIRGLLITLKHFLKNFIHMKKRFTVEYPEEKKAIPFGYRAEHRLMLRPDGQVRCTACMLCVAACPSDCIEVIAEDTGDEKIEKRPREFNINLLRCVFCGLCVEACPCDALRMDTKRYENSGYRREDFILTKERLLNNHPEGASKISVGLY